jgi:hypothetical protein
MDTKLRLTEAQIAAAREWCLCCWGGEADYIAEATPLQIQTVIARRWDGGLADFINCNPEAEMVPQDGGLFGDY